VATKLKPIKLNDAGWLYSDSYRTPMQVAMLAEFRPPADGGPEWVSNLVARWRREAHFAPPFNYRVKGRIRPRWEVLQDHQIDLDYHLRHSALPAGATERDLGILISRLHSAGLDRRYPLWECHVIEGLPNGCVALYIKVHHSQIDGVGGIRLLRRSLSIDPDARDMRPPWVVGTKGPDQSGIPPRTLPVRTAADLDSTPTPTTVSIVRQVVRSLAATYRDSIKGTDDPLRAVPYRAPSTILNGRITRPRRFATQQYSMDRLKAVAKAADCSLNDVFLAICGAALRRYLIELGELPHESLTANVPVSVREGGGASVGNAITFLYSSMGTDLDDPVERLRSISRSTALGKDRLPQVPAAAMDFYTVGLMTPFLVQAMLGTGHIGRPAMNMTISNVPGPAEPRYFDGARLEAIYPVSLLFQGQALNITAVSYDGRFNIGFTGCRDSIPHLQRIAVYSGEALAELESALSL
jgi:WS/DGAT/MGAT family acyltransferase